MGLHRLEIEVSDELLSRIDAAAARINMSRAEVVIEKLRDLPAPAETAAPAPDERMDFLKKISARIAAMERPGRSAEEIDQDIREFRADRSYER